jgi:predicted TIM-barrel enzyme
MTAPIPQSRFWSVFKNPKIILPVIHVASSEQALRNAKIAHDAGTHGVFLINHFVHSESLLKIHAEVYATFPNWWIGVNCLDLASETVFPLITNRVAGVWSDNAMIDESRKTQPDAEQVLLAQKKSDWKGLYFGGVAFKYQRKVDDVSKAVRIAAKFMDVVTTSGPSTGEAADVEKIRAMKRALGDFPLAIASGITPENVRDFLPHADCFLVATGISKSFEELDAERVRSLVNTVESCKK